MRGTEALTRTGASAAGVAWSAVESGRAAATVGLRTVAWSWAVVPSGPLGWVSSHWTMPRLHSQLYKVMDRELALQPDDELLEVACGSAFFLEKYARHVGRVAGLDLSDLQIDLARERLADRIEAGTAEIVQGDAGRLPWADESFSVVTVMGSFECFPEPEKVLAELYRVLGRGGRAVMNIGEWVEPGTQTHRMLDALWVWSEDDVRRMVEQAGFTEVAISYASTAVNRLDEMISRRMGGIAADMRIVHAIRA
jgi:SAM-dependent methyltransferase